MTPAPAASARIGRVIDDAIDRLRLDLRGLVVYTEAATGAFAVTAPLAARAGAESVFALARPWRGRPADDVAAETRDLSAAVGVADRVVIRTERRMDDLARSDIVTNLGFVRPIDADVVAALKATAAVPYMREAWELREGDIDLAACRRRGIPVIATDEHHPDVAVFDYCGLLAARMLFDAGLEICANRVIVVSTDQFGPALVDWLGRLGAEVVLAPSVRAEACWAALPRADALIVADFVETRMTIGAGGGIEAGMLAERAPGLAVIAFAGGVDGASLAAAGLRCVPAEGSAPGRMGRTLAELGPRPVAMLHGAGLKVGAEAARARARGMSGRLLVEHVCRTAPGMAMPEGGP